MISITSQSTRNQSQLLLGISADPALGVHLHRLNNLTPRIYSRLCSGQRHCADGMCHCFLALDGRHREVIGAVEVNLIEVVNQRYQVKY
jgi:hypothetical protein